MKPSYYLLFLCLVACSQIVPSPKKLLSEGEMEQVFYDLAILNAAKSIDASFYEKQGADISSLIYEKYGIDSLLLAQNISYYASNPEKCRHILSQVDARLKLEDSLLRKQQTPILPPVGEQPLDSLE